MGWDLGIGRIGAIVGPYIGSVLLQQQWDNQQLFWVAAIPAGIATLTMIAIAVLLRSKSQTPLQSVGVTSPSH